MTEGRRNKKSDTRTGKPNAVLCELYRSAVTKRQLSNTVKLSVCKSVFVPILTYSDESWLMTERMQSQVQAADMGFLPRVHGLTRREKMRSCEIHQSLTVEPLLLRIGRSQLRWFVHVTRISHRNDWRGSPTGYTDGNASKRTRWRNYLSDLAWRGLVWSQQNYSKLLKTVRYFETS